MLLRSLLIMLVSLSLAFAATPAQAAQVQLAWDAPLQANGTPVPTLAGYKLYYGSQSGQYQTTIPVGLTTTYTVTNIAAGQTSYFAVTAYDSTGTESAFSNEVSVTLGTIPQQQMRVVSVDSQELVGENGAVTNAIDGNPATFWHTEWAQQTAPLPHTLILDLGGQYQVDGVRYLPRQDGGTNGTIAGYEFYVSSDGTTWGTAVAAGTFAANTSEKIVHFTAKSGRYVRLVAVAEINGQPWTNAAELNVFGTAVTLPSVTLSAAPATITAGQASTLTWSATNATSCTAAWTTATATSGSQSVKPTATTTYTLTCTGAGGTASASTTVSINTPVGSLIPQQQFRVVSVDSQELVGENGAVTNAIDGNPATFWHTEWAQQTAPLPHTLILDLGKQYQVDGVRYLPRQDGGTNGTIAGYEFYVSSDGTTWGTAVAAGTLATNTSEQTVRFTAKTGRYVRLVAVAEINGQPWTSAAELNVFGIAVPASSTATPSSPLTQSATTASAASTAATPTAATGMSTPTAAPASTTPAAATRASLPTPAPTLTVLQHTRWELPLTSTYTYANSFLDATVTVEYTKAGAPPLHSVAFWDGGATFLLRQAFPEPGTWHYKTTATTPADSGLHNREGDVQVLPYSGPNALYRHGFLQVSADHRALVHADGTPFLWLGDTLWGATVRLTEAGFQTAVAARRAQRFTVLQTTMARADEADLEGETPWQGDRWNVRFMHKLDRLVSDANDQGLYLVITGVAELVQAHSQPQAERLAEMLGARYAAHFVSFAASLDEPDNPLHAQLNAALHRTAPRTLVTQHLGAAPSGPGASGTAEQSDDTPGVDYVLEVTGGEGDLDVACQHAIDGSLRLYHHVPPKPVVNGQAWAEGVAGGTADIAAQLGYLSLLSGTAGYTYDTSLAHATDADLPAWATLRGATYMQYLYEFFMALDEGRPLQPRHALITNQATRAQERMVVGVTADGLTYAAFLPQGGTISLDLTGLAGTTVGVTWYNPLTGQYRDQGTTAGGAVRALVSPFGASPSALVLMAQ